MIDFYYLRLCRQYPQAVEGAELEITLAELTGLFQCTTRNVNLVLKRMEDAGWIQWLPGRGRGHRSRIRLKASAEQLALETARTLVGKGDIQGAFAYLEELDFLPTVKDSFVYWLDSQFGFRPETGTGSGGDVLRLPYTKQIECLDPAKLTYVVECHMVQQVFDTLLHYNAAADSFEGHLAHYWSCAQDREWTFYLRKGVYFHHGRELTAEDVKFTLERLGSKGLNSPFRWLFADVEEVVVRGRYALSILLSRPNPLFLHHLSIDRASIVPQDVVLEQGRDFERRPVGSGAFKITLHDENRLVLEVNDRYFGKRAHLDRVEIWYTPAVERRVSQLQPMPYQMRYQSIADAELPKDWKAVETVGRECSFMVFNLKRPGPQQSLAFRRAVIHGIDRSLLELEDEAGGKLLAEWFYDKSGRRSDTDEQYDPVLARRLLRESGYVGEELLLACSSKNLKLAESLQRQMAGLGIQLSLQLLPLERMQHEAHFCFYCNVLDHDLELSVIELFLADNSIVRAFLGEELRQQSEWLIERMYREGSSLTRRAYLDRLQSMVRDQAYILFLFHHIQRTVFHPSLKNVSLSSLGWVQFRDLWFEPTP